MAQFQKRTGDGGAVDSLHQIRSDIQQIDTKLLYQITIYDYNKNLNDNDSNAIY